MPEPATGREKLIDAVVQLGSTARTLASLGLREVAREAGLNPNTFYRHFRDFDDLGVAVIDRVTASLRTGLRARRKVALSSREGASVEDLQRIVSESVGLVFDFVMKNRALVVVGIRELHGSSPVLRKALRQVVDDLAREMAEDTKDILHSLPEAMVRELSGMVMRQMLVLALEYIERPEDRAALRREAERFILLLFWGALSRESMGAGLPEAPAVAAARERSEVRRRRG